jgi:cysteine synthase
MLPFPNIEAKSIEELSFQTNNYLIQFKETLEFILANIGPDNLSSDLIEKLNSLGAEVEKTVEETEDQFQQVAGNALTVADVINSNAFKEATVTNVINSTSFKEATDVEFSVNFETGNLEYT